MLWNLTNGWQQVALFAHSAALLTFLRVRLLAFKSLEFNSLARYSTRVQFRPDSCTIQGRRPPGPRASRHKNHGTCSYISGDRSDEKSNASHASGLRFCDISDGPDTAPDVRRPGRTLKLRSWLRWLSRSAQRRMGQRRQQVRRSPCRYRCSVGTR